MQTLSKMSCWLLLVHSNNIFSTDGDVYACTYSAWPSISKFIVLLLEECWGSNPHLTEYSGLLKGYVCIEGYRYVWFDQYQFAGPSDIEVRQFAEGRAHANKNMLYWFYLPREYRQFTHLYVDLKRLLLGRVPFKVTSGDELTRTLSTESSLRTNRELYLLTEDSQDLLFYCIQSQHISVENVVPTNGWSGIESSMIAEFPHHPFRCISVLETCNIPANPVPLQSRAMIDSLITHNSDEGTDGVNQASTIGHADESVDVTCMLEIIKDEPHDDCKLDVMQEAQQNADQQQLQQVQESPQHHNLPSLEAKRRQRHNYKGGKVMSYRKLLSISKSYGDLAAAKEHAERKLWGALSSRVAPTLVLQCPGCGQYFPPSSPKSLWNLLTHMRRQHMKNNPKLLSSITDVLDILIPFMEKKIAVWNGRKTNAV